MLANPPPSCHVVEPASQILASFNPASLCSSSSPLGRPISFLVHPIPLPPYSSFPPQPYHLLRSYFAHSAVSPQHRSFLAPPHSLTSRYFPAYPIQCLHIYPCFFFLPLGEWLCPSAVRGCPTDRPGALSAAQTLTWGTQGSCAPVSVNHTDRLLVAVPLLRGGTLYLPQPHPFPDLPLPDITILPLRCFDRLFPTPSWLGNPIPRRTLQNTPAKHPSEVPLSPIKALSASPHYHICLISTDPARPPATLLHRPHYSLTTRLASSTSTLPPLHPLRFFIVHTTVPIPKELRRSGSFAGVAPEDPACCGPPAGL